MINAANAQGAVLAATAAALLATSRPAACSQAKLISARAHQASSSSHLVKQLHVVHYRQACRIKPMKEERVRGGRGAQIKDQRLRNSNWVCVCVVLFDSEVLVMDEEEGRDEAHEMTGRGGKQRETRRGWVQKRGGHS